MNEYFTTTEVASVLGIPYWRIVYVHQSGAIPEPALRIGNRRVYVSEDVRRLAEHFGIDSQTLWRKRNDTKHE